MIWHTPPAPNPLHGGPQLPNIGVLYVLYTFSYTLNQTDTVGAYIRVAGRRVSHKVLLVLCLTEEKSSLRYKQNLEFFFQVFLGLATQGRSSVKQTQDE